MMIGGRRCPTCGVEGETWRKNPDVFLCHRCNTIYNEFGVVLQGNKREDVYM